MKRRFKLSPTEAELSRAAASEKARLELDAAELFRKRLRPVCVAHGVAGEFRLDGDPNGDVWLSWDDGSPEPLPEPN